MRCLQVRQPSPREVVKCRKQCGGQGACQFVACLSRMAVDHAFLSRRITVSTPDRAPPKSSLRECGTYNHQSASLMDPSCRQRLKCCVWYVFICKAQRTLTPRDALGIDKTVSHPRPKDIYKNIYTENTGRNTKVEMYTQESNIRILTTVRVFTKDNVYRHRETDQITSK